MGIPVKERPHPATGEGLPVTMGHEFSGRIVSAPSGSDLSPGQKVMVDPRIYCSDCTRCSTGQNQGCTTLGFKGLSGSGGGFSNLVAVNAKSCFPLPESTDLSLAAVIEPLTVAWHAVKLCEIQDWSNRSVLVVGGGPVGIAHLFVLRSFGCKQIYVSEPSSARAAQNEKWAEAVINPIKENIGERCRSLTGGEGVDVVFDCAGNQKGFDAGMDAVKFKGIYMNVASWLGSQVCFLMLLIGKC
jgi:threonine dehydrogenase-like Zn-dependent dehydrogenase